MNDPTGHPIITGTALYRVPYADTDQMGFVYYANYLTLFERARNELLRNAGFTYKHLEELGLGLPVVEASLKYIKPAKYDDLLTITAQCAWIHGARLQVNCKVLRDNSILAEGFTIHVFMNLKSARPTRPCQELLERFAT